ncbi:MAG: redoxin family protein [Euryarchaeota archaeon]|nr:redoxin family protein [Euryarchaeota archaeon]
MGYEPGDVVTGFSLANANGEGEVTLDEVMTEVGIVVLFECNHCPYVVGSINRINKIAARAAELGMGFVGINSNDASVYTEDSFENMQKRADKGMPYPYLYDETQEVALAWGAKRTPEFYLLNGEGEVVYRGRLDNSPRNAMEATTRDLADAMDSLSMGELPPVNRTESIGCSVKWKL